MPPIGGEGKTGGAGRCERSAGYHDAYLAMSRDAALIGQVYNPELGFALVGNTGTVGSIPITRSTANSVRVLPWPGIRTSMLTPSAGKIFGHEDTVIRGGYGRIYGRMNGVDQVLVPLLGLGPEQPCLQFEPIISVRFVPVWPRTQALRTHSGRTHFAWDQPASLRRARPCLV